MLRVRNLNILCCAILGMLALGSQALAGSADQDGPANVSRETATVVPTGGRPSVSMRDATPEGGSAILRVSPGDLFLRTVTDTLPAAGALLEIENGGFGGNPMDWTASVDVGWLDVSPSSGVLLDGETVSIDVSVNSTFGFMSVQQATITIDAPGAISPRVRIDVTLAVLENTCRGMLFAFDIVAADDCFQSVLDGDPFHDEANFFRSFSRILRVCGEQQDGNDPLAFTDSCKEMLDQFGFPAAGRNLFGFDAGPADPLPADSPTSGDMQEFLESVLAAEVTNATEENLAQVDPSFSTFINPLEFASLHGNLALEPSADLDYGDVRILEAALRSWVGGSLGLLFAFDLDYDIDALSLLLDPVRYQQDLLDEYPSLWTLTEGGAERLASAKSELQASILAYYDASDFIRNSDDPNQNDDLFTISAFDLLDEEEFRVYLGEVFCSMDGYALMEVTNGGPLCDMTGAPVIGSQAVDLSQFFDFPDDFRDYLPFFSFDEDCGQQFIDVSNPTPNSPFPDPTLDGVLPNMTQTEILEDLGEELSPELSVFAFFSTLFSEPGGTTGRSVSLVSEHELAAPVVVSAIEMEDGEAFGIQGISGTGMGDLPQKLCLSDFLVFQLAFSPPSEGGFADRVRIVTDNPNEPVMYLDVRGCTGSSLDCDGDGVPDADDNCPDDVNPDQADVCDVLSCEQAPYGFANQVWDTWTTAVGWQDIRVGDFSGDGMDDVAGRTTTNGNWWVSVSNGNGFDKSLWGKWSTPPGGNTFIDVQVGDFNNDDRDDLFGRAVETGGLWIGLSDGSSFADERWATWATAVEWNDVLVGDFNGDGYDDVAGRNGGNGKLWVALNQAGTTFVNQLWGEWSATADWVDVSVGDFNDDGYDDLVGRQSGTGQWWVAVSDGTSFSSSRWGAWSGAVDWVDVQVADFDGDEKDDLAGRNAANGAWWVARSEGDGFVNQAWGSWSTSWEWLEVRTGQFNCDRLADIVGRSSESGRWWVALSLGDAFETEGRSTWSTSVNWLDVEVGDFDGNDVDDVSGRHSGNGRLWLGRSIATPAEGE